MKTEATDPVDDVCRMLRAWPSFLLCGHTRPDGDCLGSMLALAEALRALGKTAFCYAQPPIPEIFDFLPGVGDLLSDPRQAPAAATLLLDCSSFDRVLEGFAPPGPVGCVDHHATVDARHSPALLDPAASSTGELVCRLLDRLATPLTASMATCLYTAILTDTGGFRFSNTSAECLRRAGRLVEAGADPVAIAEACYASRPPRSLTLAGEALARLRFECGGALVWSELTRDMYERAGGEENEPDNLASEMRSARGARIVILFKQTARGARMSLRAAGQARVDRLAARFGGGGHAKAAGADLAGDYETARDAVLEAARGELAAME